MILPDTHALIWLAEGDPHLGERARQLADETLARDALGVSAITFWDTAMLHQRGRMQLLQPVEAWRQALLDQGLREWLLTDGVGIVAAVLPEFHPDPVDRFITATAFRHGAMLVTANDRMLAWSGALRRHDARQ